METVESKDLTYNNQIIALHNQTGGQKESPEAGLLVLLDGLEQRELGIGLVTVAGMLDQLNRLWIVEIEGRELRLGRNDFVGSHGERMSMPIVDLPGNGSEVWGR